MVKLSEFYQYRTYIPTLKSNKLEEFSQGENVHTKQLTTKQANASRLVSKVRFYLMQIII